MEYHVNIATKQCTERHVRGTFRPIEVPPQAKLVDQFTIGLETATPDSGESLTALTYAFEIEGADTILAACRMVFICPLPLDRRMIISVTKDGCIPISFAEFDERRPGFVTSS